MASGSTHHRYQSLITCDICEGTEDVDSYCLMCKGSICGTCSVNHTRTPMFRKHKVVPIAEGLKRQEIEEECSEHPSHIYSMHCNVCNKLVCSECIISGSHNGHDIGRIELAIQRAKQEVKEYHDTLEIGILPQNRMEEKNIAQIKEECKKVAMSLKSAINDRRAELITEVHRVCDDMISKVDDEEKQQSIQLDKSLQKVQETIKEIELLMTQSKEALIKVASELIQFNLEKPSLSHLDVQKAPKIHLSTFVPGTIDRGNVAEQIGELLLHKHVQIDTFIIHCAKYDNGIYSVNVVDENQAWIREGYGKELKLVDNIGKVVKCINTKFYTHDFAVTQSGDIIVTDTIDKCIRIMTQTGQITLTIKTNPSKPTGICLGNNNQEIVICVNTPDNSCSKLVMYSRDGKEIRTITYTDKPVGRYTSERVTQNNMGDYCIAHRHHKKVYVVDTNGGARWAYDGSGAEDLEKDFMPWDISSDIYNNLIISDDNNHKIHMLDGKGKFLRFILTEQDVISNPFGLCIDKEGRLWVGQLDGHLYIVKYLK